jgi:hypothetical protein
MVLDYSDPFEDIEKSKSLEEACWDLKAAKDAPTYYV